MALPTKNVPAFTAGPLAMPPLQAPWLSDRISTQSIMPRHVLPRARRRPEWELVAKVRPYLRQLGTCCLHAAKVMPLTLSNIIEEEDSGGTEERQSPIRTAMRGR